MVASRVSIRVLSKISREPSIVDLLFEDEWEAKKVINPEIVEKAVEDSAQKSPLFSGYYEYKYPVEIKDCSGRAKDFMERMKVTAGELVIAYDLRYEPWKPE